MWGPCMAVKKGSRARSRMLLVVGGGEEGIQTRKAGAVVYGKKQGEGHCGSLSCIRTLKTFATHVSWIIPDFPSHPETVTIMARHQRHASAH